MNKLAKRNKINVFGTTLLYISLYFLALVVALIIFLTIGIVWGTIGVILLLITIPYFVKNTRELHKILKLLDSKSQYYLEIFGDNIKINALDREYTINFSDIQRLNYSYDRPLISANFLLMYGNHKYKLNTNSEKSKSTYTMFDLSKEFVQCLKNNKKTKHGILLITTNDHFFALPEIENVEECFKELKQLINYIPSVKENEKNEYQEFLGRIYLNIMESKKKEKLDYNEEKFISLVNMIEGAFEFDLEKNIQYLEELGATNYVTLLKRTKIDIDNSKINNKIVNAEDIVVQLFNKIRILDETDPFYKIYLIPFAKENLSKYIN